MAQDVKDGVYHKSVAFPDVLLPSGYITLRYSRHALREAQTDKFLNPILLPYINLPSEINLEEMDIEEIYVEGGVVKKVTARTPYNYLYDLTYVIAMDDFTVVTVWAIKWDDYHENVDYSKYATP